ncbi:MAG: four helix bundle protein [Sphingobacteriaceae bacterium]|jgi:hypothetical protein|nr:four helix bundle protein [Sphingobacteriaceae bacterium]
MMCKCDDEGCADGGNQFNSQMEARPNLIKDLTFKFSLGIIDYCEELESIRKYNLARQLFNSGTSIGANVREAQGAESKADSGINVK